MTTTRTPLLACAALLALSPWPALAIPLSVGTSSQLQVGWQASTRTAVRLSHVGDRGTSGLNIRPTDGSGTFAVYGTPFEPEPGQESFDYSSTLRDTNTLSETRTSGFSVLAVQTTTVQFANPVALGFFERGPSVFEQTLSSP